MISRNLYISEKEQTFKHEVLMYGAGTQSTGLLLMALNGEFETKPDVAIFADTGGEPKHVINYKNYFTEYVKKEFDFNIITVQYKNLETEIKEYLKGNRKRVSCIPLRSKTGLLMRQCTKDYKINPADKKIKELYKIKRKNKEQENLIGTWLGISIDEMYRMKKSLDWWKVFIYPLIEKGFKREDTINYVKRFGLKEPPRSACYFCPFHSNHYWKYLHNKYPNEYKKAIEFDETIRNYKGLNNKMYLHKKTIPLKDVDYNQLDMFDLIDECNGYCGI